MSDPQNTIPAADKQSPGNRKQSRRNRGHESKQSKQEKYINYDHPGECSPEKSTAGYAESGESACESASDSVDSC